MLSLINSLMVMKVAMEDMGREEALDMDSEVIITTTITLARDLLSLKPNLIKALATETT